MASLDKQDIVSTGLDFLIDFWKNKPIARGILKSQLQQAQKVEDVVYKLLTERGVLVAVGVQLDRIGLIAGEQRLNRNDLDYRRAILNRLALNVSDGTIPVVLDILKSYTGTENPTLFEHFPALVISHIEQRHSTSLAATNDQAMAAGVVGYLAYTYEGTSIVGGEILSASNVYAAEDGSLLQLEDGSLLSTPSFQESWNNGHSFLGEIGEDVNPLAEIFDKRNRKILEGVYADNANDVIQLNDGSVLLWQTEEEI